MVFLTRLQDISSLDCTDITRYFRPNYEHSVVTGVKLKIEPDESRGCGIKTCEVLTLAAVFGHHAGLRQEMKNKNHLYI